MMIFLSFETFGASSGVFTLFIKHWKELVHKLHISVENIVQNYGGEEEKEKEEPLPIKKPEPKKLLSVPSGVTFETTAVHLEVRVSLEIW